MIILKGMSLLLLVLCPFLIFGEDAGYKLQRTFDGSWGFSAPNFGTPEVGIYSQKYGTGWELGVLGVQSRSPLLAPSPYLSGYWDTQSSRSSKNHWRFVLKGGVILMNSQMTTELPDEAIPEPLLQNTRQQLEQNNTDPHTLGYLDTFYYNNRTSLGGVLFGSLRAEWARAFRLIGPFDIAVGATGLLDMFTGRVGSYPLVPYPNLQTDETVALRFKPPSQPVSVGLFIGDSQNFSPLSDDVLRRYMEVKTNTGKDPRLGLEASHAPHVGVGVWGHLPISVENSFQTQYLFQRNPSTDKHTVFSQFSPSVVDLRLQYDRESGSDILFQALRFGVGVRPVPWLSVGADANFENGHYGEAGYDNRGIVFGLRGTWEHRDMVAHAQGGARAYPQDRYFERSSANYEEVRRTFNDLIDRIRSTEGADGMIYTFFLTEDSDTRQQLVAALCPRDVAAQPSPELCLWLGRNLSLIDASMQSIQDDRKFRALVIRFVKQTLIRETSRRDYSSNDLAAAFAAANTRLSPILPLRESDRDVFKKWLASQMASGLDLKRHGDGTPPTREEVIHALLNELPPHYASELQRLYGNDIQQLGDKVFDYVFELAKREANRMALEWKRVTEEFHGLRASEGLNAAQTTRNALIEAFDKDNKDRLQDVMKAPDSGFPY